MGGESRAPRPRAWYSGGMKTPTLLLAALCAGSLWAGAPETRAREAYRFDAPAKEWSAALPIGNGRLGALLFGDPNAETIVVNETSVWAPRKPWPINRQGAPVVKQVRELLFAGKRAEADREYSEKGDIAWGNQIRSYVFQPYQMVKDLRTGVESGNIQDVMDGNIDAYIEGMLRRNANA